MIEQLITDHLDLWSSAVRLKSSAGRGSNSKLELTGIKKLRELILELAVRGKLVPQDPNDEPASVLLERIAAEKARLVKEGKIKKSKPLPEITDEEKPFELPEGWMWSMLEEIAAINPRNDVDDALDASFVPMALVSTSYKGEHDFEIKKWAEIKKGFTHFANGDIGVAKITPCFENSKAVIFSGLVNGVGAGTTELHVARPYTENVLPLFILLNIKSPVYLKKGEAGMTGTAGQKRLAKEFFSFYPLPIPPLAEQYRIVAKVDELMSLCDQLEQKSEASLAAHQTLVETLLATLTESVDSAELAQNWVRLAQHFDSLFTTQSSIDTLKQTILQLAVMGKLVPQDPNDEPASVLLERIAAEKARLIKEGKIKKEKPLPPISEEEKPFALPDGWEWKRLTDVFNVIVDCPHSTPKFVESGYLSIDTNSFKQGELVFEKFRYVSEETYHDRNKRLIPQSGDIVFAREGSVGESVVIPSGIECCLGQRVMLFRPSAHLNPFFLRLTISSSGALNTLLSLHKGIGAKHVNVSDMKNYVVAVPPHSEQKRVIVKVDELMSLCDQLSARLQANQTTQLHLAEALVEGALN